VQDTQACTIARHPRDDRAMVLVFLVAFAGVVLIVFAALRNRRDRSTRP
jgi:hypothetical protein